MLLPEQRQRYARQLLLEEIGPSGQERLLSCEVWFAAGADERAADVAREYLLRAGLGIADEPASATALQVPLVDAARVARVAGSTALEPAAAALCGAFAAVEAIKQALGVGTKSELPAELSLAEEVLP